MLASTKAKIEYINKRCQLVMADQDLTLINDKKELEITSLKRIVQDCISTLECNGNTEFDRNELEYYTDRLINVLKN